MNTETSTTLTPSPPRSLTTCCKPSQIVSSTKAK